MNNCENRRARTFDPLLKRQMLYQLSYILNLTYNPLSDNTRTYLFW